MKNEIQSIIELGVMSVLAVVVIVVVAIPVFGGLWR